MLGIIFAFLAAITNGVEQIFHRHVVSKEDDIAYACIWMFLCSLFFLPFAIIDLHYPKDLYPWILVILSIIIWTLFNLIYFKSVSLLEISASGPFLKFKLIFVFILSILFLGESNTLEKIAGTILILIGSFFSYQKINVKGIHLTLIASFIMALGFLLDKALTSYFPPTFLGFILYFFPALLLTPLILKKPEQTIKLIKNRKRSIIAAAFFAFLTYYFILNSFIYLEASVAIPLFELNSIITFFGGALLLNEKFNLKMRAVGALLALLGAIIISL